QVKGRHLAASEANLSTKGFHNRAPGVTSVALSMAKPSPTSYEPPQILGCHEAKPCKKAE
ncbi:hypothetical protein, partial [Klebsiella pneumoniae]|uniref:hypothetical protein n=1 Tax=Klebsiella pneumoniae TaxID=573 RepID=UPI00272F56E2